MDEPIHDARFARLRRIAPSRRLPTRDVSITGLIAAAEKDARRAQRRLGSFSECWAALVPENIRADCQLGDIRGGAVTILVGSSAAKFELDRLLRAGLEAQLRSNFDGPLTRVKTKLAAL